MSRDEILSMVGNMAVVVFRFSALFHVILLILKFSCSFCYSHDAFISNVSRTDGFTNVVSEFNVTFEYCAVSHYVNSSLIDYHYRCNGHAHLAQCRSSCVRTCLFNLL